MHGKRVTWDFFFKDKENTDKICEGKRRKKLECKMAMGSVGNVALFFMGPSKKKVLCTSNFSRDLCFQNTSWIGNNLMT